MEESSKELGKKNVTFTLNVQDTPVQKISAEFIKSQLETNLPGVEVKVKQLPFKQKINLELSNNYQASYAGWSPDYPDPMAFLEIMKTGNPQNNTDWGNKEYDQLIKDANGKLLQEPEKRNEALQQAEKFY